MRPVSGSATTTDPFKGPSDSTAARRTSRFSPSTLSPTVESAKVGSSHWLRASFLRRVIGLVGPEGEMVPMKCLLVACATTLPVIALPAFGAGFATCAAVLLAGFRRFFFLADAGG